MDPDFGRMMAQILHQAKEHEKEQEDEKEGEGDEKENAEEIKLSRSERLARLLDSIEGTYDMRERNVERIDPFLPHFISIEKAQDGFYKETRQFVDGTETEFLWKPDGVWRENVKTLFNGNCIVHIAKLRSNERIDSVTYRKPKLMKDQLLARVGLAKDNQDYGCAYYFTPSANNLDPE